MHVIAVQHWDDLHVEQAVHGVEKVSVCVALRSLKVIPSQEHLQHTWNYSH